MSVGKAQLPWPGTQVGEPPRLPQSLHSAQRLGAGAADLGDVRVERRDAPAQRVGDADGDGPARGRRQGGGQDGQRDEQAAARSGRRTAMTSAGRWSLRADATTDRRAPKSGDVEATGTAQTRP